MKRLALLLALGGAALASADESSTSTTTNGYSQQGQQGQEGAQSGRGPGNGATDPSKPMRSDETLLTGDTATKVQAAALAKYPGATVQRVETDSDGLYEAHLALTDGSEIIVQVGSDFAVTGTQTMGAGGSGGRGQLSSE